MTLSLFPFAFRRLLHTTTARKMSAPINLVSVNTAPDRAKKVIGAVIEEVKDRYNLVHAGNAESELSWKAECDLVIPPRTSTDLHNRDRGR